MNATATMQEVFGQGAGSAGSSHAVGGSGAVGGGGGGWSQRPVFVEDHGTAVRSELVQKSSVMQQQQSVMSGRQDVNAAGTGAMLAVNSGALNAASRSHQPTISSSSSFIH